MIHKLRSLNISQDVQTTFCTTVFDKICHGALGFVTIYHESFELFPPRFLGLFGPLGGFGIPFCSPGIPLPYL